MFRDLKIACVLLFMSGCGPSLPSMPTPNDTPQDSDAKSDILTDGEPLPEGDENCPLGGTKIIKYRDTDGSKSRSDGDEIVEIQYDCHGDNPSPGSDNSGENPDGDGGGNQSPNESPVTYPAGAITVPGSATTVALSGYDPDNDALTTWIIVKGPGNGKLSGMAPPFTYTPNSNFVGTDRFTFKVQDARGATSAIQTATILVGGQVLLVVNDADNAPATAQDNWVKSTLETAGLTVTKIDEEVVTPADANGKALILISFSAESLLLGDKLKSVAVPILTWDQLVAREMSLINKDKVIETVNDQTTIDFLSTTHPITRGLKSPFKLSDTPMQLYHVMPLAGATSISSIAGDAAKSVFYVLEPGTPDFGGIPVPARRVCFPHLDLAGVNDSMRQLFQAAVAYAIAGT